MKQNQTLRAALLILLTAPLFINAVCSKDEDIVPVPDTDEYVTWQIPGHNGNLTTPPDEIAPLYLQGGNIVLFGSTSGNTENFYASFNGSQAAGTYPSTYFNIYVNGKHYVQSANPVQINITSYGGNGQLITGSYAGTLKDSTSTATYNVSGLFKIRNQ